MANVAPLQIAKSTASALSNLSADDKLHSTTWQALLPSLARLGQLQAQAFSILGVVLWASKI
jgi:hypothetical protein